MPKPFKLFSARPSPSGADIIDHEGARRTFAFATNAVGRRRFIGYRRTAEVTCARRNAGTSRPRSTVEALVLNKAKGCGPETVNHYIRVVRGFFRWFVGSKRIGSNRFPS
jgi:hypothetical protein